MNLIGLDLTSPGALKMLSDTIKADIDAYCVTRYDDGPRSHLGASQIGNPCSRALWYHFRWIHHVTHSGRQYRLFQRGHFEEPRFASYLSGIGCEVRELALSLWYHPESDSYFIDDADMQKDNLNMDAQLSNDVTKDLAHIEAARKQGVVFDKGKAQIRISGCQGHFGGSVDAVIKLPERYGMQNVLFLGEYKTSGTGRKFDDLVKQGCQIKKHQHFAQQAIYGYKLGIEYGIYIVVNKDNDDLYIEVIKLDWELGKQLEEKAEKIIFASEPPERIAMSKDYFDCKWCDYKEICWGDNKNVDKNCRSCVCCKPVDEANWECSIYGIVPKEFIKTGCNDWESII